MVVRGAEGKCFAQAGKVLRKMQRVGPFPGHPLLLVIKAFNFRETFFKIDLFGLDPAKLAAFDRSICHQPSGSEGE
jgi:hypothetical protein